MCGTPVPKDSENLSETSCRKLQGASALPGGHWPTKTPPGRGENVPAGWQPTP